METAGRVQMEAELAGRLRQRLRFEKRIAIPDGGGGSGDHWAVAGEVWGELRPLDRSALSVLAAEGRLSARRWRIVIREGLPLHLDMRVFWRGLMMRLTGIERDPLTPDRVTILAEELGPQR
jgi:head-tail adaptor